MRHGDGGGCETIPSNIGMTEASLSAGTAQLGERELVVRVPARGPQSVDFEVQTSASGLGMSQAALRFASLLLDAVGEVPNA